MRLYTILDSNKDCEKNVSKLQNMCSLYEKYQKNTKGCQYHCLHHSHRPHYELSNVASYRGRPFPQMLGQKCGVPYSAAFIKMRCLLECGFY